MIVPIQLPNLQHSMAATDPCSLSESGYPFCSSVSVPAAESFDVGKYTCSHAISSHYPRPINDTVKEDVYVYVKGKDVLKTELYLDAFELSSKGGGGGGDSLELCTTTLSLYRSVKDIFFSQTNIVGHSRCLCILLRFRKPSCHIALL